MAEWLKAHAWKACLGETLTWVRIPLSPPVLKHLTRFAIYWQSTESYLGNLLADFAHLIQHLTVTVAESLPDVRMTHHLGLKFERRAGIRQPCAIRVT